MKNIHVLPTDKPSRLYKTGNFLLLDSKAMPNNTLETMNQHIYITSDEEIKERDWYLVVGGIGLAINTYYKSYGDTPKNDWLKKIILTTDQDLIKDGVQAIDDEFLEWFVKNPSCEWVEVKHDYDTDLRIVNGKNLGYYSIIIPQEEPKQEWTPTQGETVWIKVFSNWSKGTYIGYDVVKQTHLVREDEEGGGYLMSSSEVLPYYSMPNKPKQETLEEAAENEASIFYEKGTIEWNKYRQVFELGAKWQAERMYSEEEVQLILSKLLIDIKNGNAGNSVEWFKQFKKKQ